MRKPPAPPPLSADEAIDAELRTWAWLVDARAAWIDDFRPADLPNYDKALAAYLKAAQAEVELFKATWLVRPESGPATDPN